jgi:hypothetical protein
MSLFSKLYEKIYPHLKGPLPSNEETQLEAKKAVQSAEIAYTTAVGNDPQVSRVVLALKSQRERNHFAELLEITMRGNG